MKIILTETICFRMKMFTLKNINLFYMFNKKSSSNSDLYYLLYNVNNMQTYDLSKIIDCSVII